jgi:hypothetical protein
VTSGWANVSATPRNHTRYCTFRSIFGILLSSRFHFFPTVFDIYFCLRCPSPAAAWPDSKKKKNTTTFTPEQFHTANNNRVSRSSQHNPSYCHQYPINTNKSSELFQALCNISDPSSRRGKSSKVITCKFPTSCPLPAPPPSPLHHRFLHYSLDISALLCAVYFSLMTSLMPLEDLAPSYYHHNLPFP